MKKTSALGLVSAALVAISLNAAPAQSRVFIGFGFGHPFYHPMYHPMYRHLGFCHLQTVKFKYYDYARHKWRTGLRNRRICY